MIRGVEISTENVSIHFIWDTADGVEAGAQCYREARQVRMVSSWLYNSSSRGYSDYTSKNAGKLKLKLNMEG